MKQHPSSNVIAFTISETTRTALREREQERFVGSPYWDMLMFFVWATVGTVIGVLFNLWIGA